MGHPVLFSIVFGDRWEARAGFLELIRIKRADGFFRRPAFSYDSPQIRDGSGLVFRSQKAALLVLVARPPLRLLL
jgi:hypothetical protein